MKRKKKTNSFQLTSIQTGAFVGAGWSRGPVLVRSPRTRHVPNKQPQLWLFPFPHVSRLILYCCCCVKRVSYSYGCLLACLFLSVLAASTDTRTQHARSRSINVSFLIFFFLHVGFLRVFFFGSAIIPVFVFLFFSFFAVHGFLFLLGFLNFFSFSCEILFPFVLFSFVFQIG